MGGTVDGSIRVSGTITAGEVIGRIKKSVHVPWRSNTVDVLVSGDPDIPVRGISTAFMATFDVLTRSAAAGRNMVITHEPTFYMHQDALNPAETDAVYRGKVDFIRAHEMAVFRFHDHWHADSPDGIAAGMVRELGWETHADAADPNLFLFSGTPLVRFASDIGSLLSARTIRVIGDPDLPVHRVLASW